MTIKAGSFAITMTADGTSVDTWAYDGSKGNIGVDGTFGSGTISLEYSPNQGIDWFVDDTTFAAKGSMDIATAKGPMLVRALLAGSSGASIKIIFTQG